MNEQQEKEFSQMSHLQKLIIQIEMMIEYYTRESVPCLEEELKYYSKQENPLYFRGVKYGILLSLNNVKKLIYNEEFSEQNKLWMLEHYNTYKEEFDSILSMKAKQQTFIRNFNITKKSKKK